MSPHGSTGAQPKRVWGQRRQEHGRPAPCRSERDREAIPAQAVPPILRRASAAEMGHGACRGWRADASLPEEPGAGTPCIAGSVWGGSVTGRPIAMDRWDFSPTCTDSV